MFIRSGYSAQTRSGLPDGGGGSGTEYHDVARQILVCGLDAARRAPVQAGRDSLPFELLDVHEVEANHVALARARGRALAPQAARSVGRRFAAAGQDPAGAFDQDAVAERTDADRATDVVGAGKAHRLGRRTVSPCGGVEELELGDDR